MEQILSQNESLFGQITFPTYNDIRSWLFRCHTVWTR